MRAAPARERQPHFLEGVSTGDGTLSPPTRGKQGFPVYHEAFPTRGYIFNVPPAARMLRTARGFANPSEITCNALHAPAWSPVYTWVPNGQSLCIKWTRRVACVPGTCVLAAYPAPQSVLLPVCIIHHFCCKLYSYYGGMVVRGSLHPRRLSEHSMKIPRKFWPPPSNQSSQDLFTRFFFVCGAAAVNINILPLPTTAPTPPRTPPPAAVSYTHLTLPTICSV